MLDCTCIMNLSGADYANSDKYARSREQIWKALEELIRQGRLKTVPQVMQPNGELEFNDQPSYQRLFPLRSEFTLSVDNSVENEIPKLLGKYDLIDPNITYTRDPADPYLVVCARAYGYTVVTDETSKQAKRGRRRRKDYLPDVCAGEGVRCITFEQFLNEVGIGH